MQLGRFSKAGIVSCKRLDLPSRDGCWVDFNTSIHPYAVRLHEGGFEITAARTPEGKSYKLLNLPYFLAGRIHDYLGLLIK